MEQSEGLFFYPLRFLTRHYASACFLCWLFVGICQSLSAQKNSHTILDRSNPVCIAVNQDDSRIVIGAGDGTIKIWDKSTGKYLRVMKHADLVASVALHSSGTRILSGSYDKTIKVWNSQTGALVRTFDGHTKEVMSVLFSPDESKVASGSFDASIKLWDVNTGTCLRTLQGHLMGVNCVAFSKDGKWLASASYDSTLKIWDVATGACLKTLRGHEKGVTGVCLSPDGKYAVSTSYDSTLKVWDLSSGACLRTLRGHFKGVTAVSLSTDGKRALSSSYDKTIKCWNVMTGQCVETFVGHRDEVNAVTFFHNGKEMASVSQDNTIRIWDLPLRPAELIQAEVQRKMKPWLEKGKYETSTAYQTRTSSSAKEQMAQSLAKPIIDSLGYLRSDRFNAFLEDYDPDRQEFRISFESPEVVPFSLTVPLKDAEIFENDFENVTFKRPKFAFNNREEFEVEEVEAFCPKIGKGYSYHKTGKHVSFSPSFSTELKSDRTRVQAAAVPEVREQEIARPPKIEIIQPKVERGKQFHHAEKKMTVKGNVKADGGLFLLLVNGIETHVNQDGTFQAEVPIGYQDNMIYLKAIDRRSQISVDSMHVYRAFDHANVVLEKRKGTDYALVIATDEYQEYKRLSNPIFDGQTVAKELESNYGFKVETVKNPTHAELYTILRQYSKRQFADDDQLFIFIAGHGEFDAVFSEGYLVTTDSKMNDEIKESFVSHSNIRTIVNNIPCKHVLLMLDVCFGGTFDQSTGNTRGADIPTLEREKFIQRKLALTTRKYITSGGKEYVPDGRPGFHSPFAAKFLEALRTYGGEDKILTFNELYSHVERAVPGPKAGEFGSNQPGSDFLFIAK